MIIDQLVRSKRKTVAIQITKDARLVVRAPYHISLKKILDFVDSKSGWIEKKKAEIQHWQTIEGTRLQIQAGSQFLYLGKPLTINWTESRQTVLAHIGDILWINVKHREQAPKLLHNWYKVRAREYFAKRVPELADLTGLHRYRSIHITSARTRWGSCSSKGYLNFSCRLISAPVAIIDYVIIHELVHLEIHNHSRIFWEKVELFLPDFRESRNWLKQFHPNLPF